LWMQREGRVRIVELGGEKRGGHKAPYDPSFPHKREGPTQEKNQNHYLPGTYVIGVERENVRKYVKGGKREGNSEAVSKQKAWSGFATSIDRPFPKGWKFDSKGQAWNSH